MCVSVCKYILMLHQTVYGTICMPRFGVTHRTRAVNLSRDTGIVNTGPGHIMVTYMVIGHIMVTDAALNIHVQNDAKKDFLTI